MVAEALIACVDDSDFSRNGDYPLTRLIAQRQVLTALADYRSSQNPENTMGILTMAGKHPKVWVSSTTDATSISQAAYEIRSNGRCNIIAALHCAVLALKHRDNTSYNQRILLFCCSPIDDRDNGKWENIAKLLRKNSVNLDVVSFGEVNKNHEILSKLVKSANDENCGTLIEVPPNTDLRDAVMKALNNGGDDGNLEETDPELALAIRLSMETERARQIRAKEQQESASNGADGNNDVTNKPTDAKDQIELTNTAIQNDELEMDEELRLALELSLKEAQEAEQRKKMRESELTSEPPKTDTTETQDSNNTQDAANIHTQASNVSSEDIEAFVKDKKPNETEELFSMVLEEEDLNNAEIIRALKLLQEKGFDESSDDEECKQS